MKHKHRIIPGHMGGTYESSNVVMLTREEHAEAHQKLHEKYGRDEDRWAAHMLGKPQDLTGENNPRWRGGVSDKERYWENVEESRRKKREYKQANPDHHNAVGRKNYHKNKEERRKIANASARKRYAARTDEQKALDREKDRIKSRRYYWKNKGK